MTSMRPVGSPPASSRLLKQGKSAANGRLIAGTQGSRAGLCYRPIPPGSGGPIVPRLGDPWLARSSRVHSTGSRRSTSLQAGLHRLSFSVRAPPVAEGLGSARTGLGRRSFTPTAITTRRSDGPGVSPGPSNRVLRLQSRDDLDGKALPDVALDAVEIGKVRP